MVDENVPTLALAATLKREGTRIATTRPPTVSAEMTHLRITLSAAHTGIDIEYLAQALEMAGQSLQPAKTI